MSQKDKWYDHKHAQLYKWAFIALDKTEKVWCVRQAGKQKFEHTLKVLGL